MDRPIIPFAPALVRFLESPVALQLAAAGEGLRPSSTRGFGCRVEEDRRTLCLLLLQAQSTRLLSDLDVGSRVAVNASHVLDLRGLQAKGRLLEVRAATDPEREASREYRTALVEMFARVGVPPEACGGLWQSGPVVALRLAVDALFDQTPGAGAGQKLETTWKRL